MLNLDVELHRLIWSPDDFDGDKLRTSAFRRKDLSGLAEDYVSVSRLDKLSPDAEISTAANQAEKAGVGELKREEAWSVLLNCNAVESTKDENESTLFSVTEEPIENVNFAHCGIRNISGQNSKGHINKLRAILVKLAHSPRKLDNFLDQFKC